MLASPALAALSLVACGTTSELAPEEIASRRPAPTAVLEVAGLDAGEIAISFEGAGAGEAAQSDPKQYVEPVEGEVSDKFRKPEHIGAPGNRGWQYEVETDSPIVAVKQGYVHFAGQVGSSRYVSINHLDGIRSTYSHVKDIAVKKGDFVEQGQLLARTARDTFHFGAIQAGDYLDPALLFEVSALPPLSFRLAPRGAELVSAP